MIPVPKCKQCTVLPKILKCVLYDQIVLHLNKYSLLIPHLSVFHSGYFT